MFQGLAIATGPRLYDEGGADHQVSVGCPLVSVIGSESKNHFPAERRDSSGKSDISSESGFRTGGLISVRSEVELARCAVSLASGSTPPWPTPRSPGPSDASRVGGVLHSGIWFAGGATAVCRDSIRSYTGIPWSHGNDSRARRASARGMHRGRNWITRRHSRRDNHTARIHRGYSQ